MRAVLDPNVIISGLLSPRGKPARLLKAWERGEFELIVSAVLLDELERALAYPKLRRRISEDEAGGLVQWLTESAMLVGDPVAPAPVHSADPGDDYLIALASSRQAILVSGDKHLLKLADRIPVLEPALFLDQLSKEATDIGG
ncbi:MAG: putative toxin-antitoxin system toxin component, PIN family [Solirubrobacteraceae bacterium]